MKWGRMVEVCKKWVRGTVRVGGAGPWLWPWLWGRTTGATGGSHFLGLALIPGVRCRDMGAEGTPGMSIQERQG